MGYFYYTDTETEYLKKKDKRLGAVIDQLGHLEREVFDDLFEALVYSIVGQQVSTKAQVTIWNRIRAQYGAVTPDAVADAGPDALRSLGISGRKAGYILDAAQKIRTGELNLDALRSKSDVAVERELCALNGIGVWTAQMLMTFCMQRKNIMSFGDYGIRKGLRMLYHHREIDQKLFDKYYRRYSPYATVASLYLWEIAGGAIPTMRDFAPKKK